MKYIVTLNGKQYEVEVEKTQAAITAVNDVAPVAAPVQAAPVQAASATAAAPAAVTAGTAVLAPMPGAILSVAVQEGAAVKAGDLLFILEAMKMENEIVAPCDGSVKQLLAQKGATVNTDDTLAVIG